MRLTWLQSESYAYPHGGQTRKGAALFPDGKIRRVWAGIPDTWFSIPAHTRIRGKYIAGYVTYDDDTREIVFREYSRYSHLVPGTPNYNP